MFITNEIILFPSALFKHVKHIIQPRSLEIGHTCTNFLPLAEEFRIENLNMKFVITLNRVQSASHQTAMGIQRERR